MQQNSRLLQQKLAEKNKLLCQLEQAKMQEEMNKAMAQLNETVGDDVPTLNEVQQKIEARYAKAKASSELQETSVESGSSRSSRPPPTSRPRAASASCAPSSASTGSRRRRPRRSGRRQPPTADAATRTPPHG